MSETTHGRDLEWESMSDPVPFDLFDPDFEIPGTGELRTASGTAALARSESGDAQPPSQPPSPSPSPSPASQSDTGADFANLRAQLEAASSAEEEARIKAEEEEAAQRERLEQWMANARARLQAADQDPAVPGAPPRVRREPSPTVMRLAEMQKTMFDAGAAEAETMAEGAPGRAVFFPGPGMNDGPVDPMATIIVHRDSFIEAAPIPAPPAPSPAAVLSAFAKEASAKEVHAQAEDPRTAKLKAVERKVAQIRLAEAGAETMIMAPVIPPKSNHVRVAIWVFGGLIPVILGLGVYALTEAGYLDGMGDLFPTLSSTFKTKHGAAPRPALSTRESPRAEAARIELAKAEKARVQAPAAVPSNATVVNAAPVQPAPRPIIAAAATPAPVPAKASKAALEQQRRTALLLEKAERARKAKIVPAKPRHTPVTSARSTATPYEPETSALSAAASPSDAAMEIAHRNADASVAGIQVANQDQGDAAEQGSGEAELKASIQTALHANAEAVQGIYDRFAMGIPGLTGDVVIGLTVNPNGRIAEGSVAASTTTLASFDQELLRRVLGWKLSPFSGNRPRYVAVPFHFDPKDPN